MKKLSLKFLYVFFLIENSCLNCLKVDRTQNIEEKKKKKFFFFNFLIKGYLSPLQLSPQALGGDSRRRKLPLDGAAYL